MTIAEVDLESAHGHPLSGADADPADAMHAGDDRLRSLHLAIMTFGSDLDLESVLHRIVEAAVDLVGARFGAVGVLSDDRSRFIEFVTPGTYRGSDALLGELSQRLGILRVPIVAMVPMRMIDLQVHPGSVGFTTRQPSMTAFLGVPVLAGGEPFGNLYLAEALSGEPFTASDQEVVVALAAAAGLAIDRARLHERLSRADVAEDRERIARDLHDIVVQRIFATALTLQAALQCIDANVEASDRIEQAIDDLDKVVREVRTTVFELEVAIGPRCGIRRQLLELGDELSSALGFRPSFEFDGPVDAVTTEEVAPDLLAAVGEALVNVARHAHSPSASVLITADATSLCALVDDEGIGPRSPRVGGHGLANLTQRAGLHGGTSSLEARPSGGSRLRWKIAI